MTKNFIDKYTIIKFFILFNDAVNKSLMKCPLNWKIAFKVSELYVFRILFMLNFEIKEKNFYDLRILFVNY